MLTVEAVREAAKRLSGVAHRTPVLTSSTLNERVGAEVFCKAENLQRVGAFKFRGAFNAIAALREATPVNGVITYSSGNHGQAVALAARLHQVSATVVMPHDAPEIKKRAVAGYGATIVPHDRFDESREDIAAALSRETGAIIIPPFDHWDVMAGQGTTALELLEDRPDIDTLVVCVGGGGLIAGCATVAKAHGDIRVVGVEPVAGDDVRRSLEAGRIVTIDQPETIADGQATRAPGEKTFAVMKERVDEVVTVSDEDLVATMRFAFERMKIVLEPSGASALASVLHGKVPHLGQRVGITLSGGNVGADDFARLIQEG